MLLLMGPTSMEHVDASWSQHTFVQSSARLRYKAFLVRTQLLYLAEAPRDMAHKGVQKWSWQLTKSFCAKLRPADRIFSARFARAEDSSLFHCSEGTGFDAALTL